MSRRVEINRLSRDELVYELTWRGIASGTVEEMRGRLAVARQIERSGESLHYPPYPFTFAEDVQSVARSLDLMTPLVDNFSGSDKDAQFLKLTTRLNHVLARIDNIIPATVEERTIRSVLLAENLSLIDKLNNRVTYPPPPLQSQIPLNLCVLQNTISGTAMGAPLSSSSPVNSPSSVAQGANISSVQAPQPTITQQAHTSFAPPAHNSFGFAPILPHKWNIKFSGDKRGSSVTSFFEKVEDLRAARGVSKHILLNSGIDLFEGRAYEFYQDCRSEVNSWDELVQKFKEEYQPAFYSEKLLEEIKRRTQGADETIGTYIAVMSKYFQRLECTVSEEAKLTILLRNIAPMYKNQLGAVEITSLSQLKSLCRRIEQRMQSEYVPPPRKGHSLEPDLAYIGSEPELEGKLEELRVEQSHSGSPQGQSSSRNGRLQQGSSKEVVCFRCNKSGHRAIGCAEPKKLVCFGCKKEGFTKRTCPSCSSGNGYRRS